MAASLPNINNTTRRKKRDLETTMNTLKQNLAPSLPSKKGTRIKNKPRNLPKKVLPQRVESCLSYGEFYPDKLKRKKSKKVVLKPKHDYKVIVSTNKRKRRTPHKGLSFDDRLPIILSKLTATDKAQIPLTQDLQTPISQENQTPSTQDTQILKQNKSCKSLLKVQTSRCQEIVNYKLISPPHKSLTELTVEDLMRMDDDSLSDEDMMEILTCPSPVWWEEPCDDYKEGDLHLFEARQNSRTNPNLTADETLKGTNKSVFYASSTNIKMDFKITNANTVGKMRTKTKRIAKLESVLDHIKNKMQNNNNHNHKNCDDKLKINFNSNDLSNCEDNRAKDQRNEEMKKIDDNKANKRKNTVDLQEVYKPRKLSSSCSDNSVNEDDLLRNLETIDIPIQKTAEVNDLIFDSNSRDNNNKNNMDDFDKICAKNIKVVENKFIQEYQDIYSTRKKSAKQRKYKVNSCQNQLATVKPIETKNNEVESKRVKKGCQKNTPNRSSDKHEVKKDTTVNTDILKRLKPQYDDILDVRLIKTPTNTNQIKVWSKLDNFKLHSYKPEDFVEVIDVEDELAFSMIISPSKTHDPLDISKPRTETILIEDDDSDNDCNIDKATAEENVIHTVVIEANNDATVDSPKATHPNENMMNINDETIIKEDTIKIGNNLDVRLIETSPETNISKNNRKDERNILRGHSKMNLLKLLPIETLRDSLSAPDESTCINSITEIDSDGTTVAYSDQKVTLLKKPEQLNKYEGECINDIENTFLNNKVGVIVKTLPTLIQNPTFDSPKSTKSFISVASESASIESSEGTISDTNIKFIDDYEGKVDFLDEESQSSQTDVIKEKESVTDTDDDTKSLSEENTVQTEKDDSIEPEKSNNIDHKTAQKHIYIEKNDNVDLEEDIINQLSNTVICHTQTVKKCAEKTAHNDSCTEVEENPKDELTVENKAKTVIRTYSKKVIA